MRKELDETMIVDALIVVTEDILLETASDMGDENDAGNFKFFQFRSLSLYFTETRYESSKKERIFFDQLKFHTKIK